MNRLCADFTFECEAIYECDPTEEDAQCYRRRADFRKRAGCTTDDSQQVPPMRPMTRTFKSGPPAGSP
jgi:hypothetical protein